MSDVPHEGPLPDGWSGGEAVTKYWKGNYAHLFRLTRQCNKCGVTITLDVSKRALTGEARNAGLKIVNCGECRAKHKAGGPGSRGGRSRPIVVQPAEGEGPTQAAIDELKRELEECRADNIETSDDHGALRKAIHEELGLSLIGSAINYSSVKMAIAELRGKPAVAVEEPKAATDSVLPKAFPWD